MNLFGPPDIEKLKAKRDVKGLIKALGYKKSSHMRGEAAKVLGLIGEPAAVEALVLAYQNDAEKFVRGEALSALSNVRNVRAVEPFIALLKHPDSKMRMYVASALGLMRAPQAVAPLCDLLMDGDRDVRWWAATALGRIGDARAVQPLIAALADRDSVVCGSTAEALGELCLPTAVEPLIAALKHVDFPVRWQSAQALGKIGARIEDTALLALLVDALLLALKDEDEIVRQHTAQALGRIDPQLVNDALRLRTVEALQVVRIDFIYNVRLAASKALETFGLPAEDMDTDEEYDSLGSRVDPLFMELYWIGRLAGFRSVTAGGKFGADFNHIRAREIGTILNGIGGMPLMRMVHKKISQRLPGEARSLEGAWDYIGEWRA